MNTKVIPARSTSGDQSSVRGVTAWGKKCVNNVSIMRPLDVYLLTRKQHRALGKHRG